MKKIIALIMSSALCASMVMTAVAADPVYNARDVKVTVNGAQYNVLGYEVPGGGNGVKIRTLASILNGTSKQFNVSFSDGVVDIVVGEGYAAPLGTELEAFTGAEPTGVYSTHMFKINGTLVGMEAALASDYNYIPLENFIYSILGSTVIEYEEDGGIIIDTESEISDEEWG